MAKLMDWFPVYERGGVWGTGRFPTLSRRRGLRRRKHGFRSPFRWRTRAKGERCSCRRQPSAGEVPSLGVGLDELGKVARGSSVDTCECVLDE